MGICFIFTDLHTELLAHSQDICEILEITQTNTVNFSVSVLVPYDIGEILPITTNIPANLSTLVEITKLLGISHLSIILFLELQL